MNKANKEFLFPEDSDDTSYIASRLRVNTEYFICELSLHDGESISTTYLTTSLDSKEGRIYVMDVINKLYEHIEQFRDDCFNALELDQ